MGWEEGRNFNLKDALNSSGPLRNDLKKMKETSWSPWEKTLPRQKECWEQSLWVSGVFGRLEDQLRALV